MAATDLLTIFMIFQTITQLEQHIMLPFSDWDFLAGNKHRFFSLSFPDLIACFFCIVNNVPSSEGTGFAAPLPDAPIASGFDNCD